MRETVEREARAARGSLLHLKVGERKEEGGEDRMRASGLCNRGRKEGGVAEYHAQSESLFWFTP